MPIECVEPDWQVPGHVRALTTTRGGGISTGEFSSLNLGDHVGDEPARVAANRARLREQLKLPAEPTWLTQVHGCDVVAAGGAFAGQCTPHRGAIDGGRLTDAEGTRSRGGETAVPHIGGTTCRPAWKRPFRLDQFRLGSRHFGKVSR